MQLLLRLVANTFGYIGIEPIHCSVLGICLSEERNACCRKNSSEHSLKYRKRLLTLYIFTSVIQFVNEIILKCFIIIHRIRIVSSYVHEIDYIHF
jgi:hypothetical protein